MNLLVDGAVYRFQQFGGINTLFNETLPALATRHGVSVSLLLDGSWRGELPGARVRLVRGRFTSTRIGRALWMRTKRDRVFMSTYLGPTPAHTPGVAVAYDMNHEIVDPKPYGDLYVRLRQHYPVYLRSATRIVAISEKTRADVIRFCGIAPETIDVVHLASNPRTFYPDPDPQPDGGPYVLFVGGRHPYKNFGLMLTAVAGLRRLGLSLVVAGKAWNPAELASLDQLRIASGIRLVPTPRDAALRKLYSNAFAFAFPSLHEGFGLPLLEAMSCGTAVLAADTEVFREVAGDAPVYFNPNDVESFLAAAERLLTPSVRADHVAAGAVRAGRYSWERTTDGLHASLVRALGSG